MLEDFRPNRDLHRVERRRFGASLAMAAVILAASSAAAITAVDENRHDRKKEEELVQIEFREKPPAPPPPPAPLEPPPAPATPEPPKPVPKERPKPPKVIKTPVKLSDEKLAESDAPLPDIPVGGLGGGVAGGVGTGAAVAAPPPPPPPPPKLVPVLKPMPLVLPVGASTPRPRYSSGARRKGIEGVVLASFDVLEDGRVANVTIISGPPELHETVIKSLAQWRFKPAQRGGKPLKYRIQQSFRFNLQDP